MEKNIMDIDIVKRDIEALYIGNLNTVEFDLDLPTKGAYGSEITWKTGHDRIISVDGKVTRPVYGMGNREVPLYATFKYGEATENKTYLVVVLEEKNKVQVEKIHTIELTASNNEEYYLPAFVVIDTKDGKTISHAVTWNNGISRKYDVPGIYKEVGVIQGTSIPVKATVKVEENFQKEKKSTASKLLPFSAKEVSLEGENSFLKSQERMHEFLLSVNDDQMLYNFRSASGLDTLGAPEMIGWDSPNCLLRGHTTGHYLSALALCFGATKDKKILGKLNYMIKSLGECQDCFESNKRVSKGFLSAYDEDQFDKLEKYVRYPKIWAPYYTLHKIFAGLLDCYHIGKNEQALHIADKLGDWVYNRLSKLSHEQRIKMWGIYIAGEFGGMNDVLAQLYNDTKKEEHLIAAKMFDNDKLFYPMETKVDALDGLHANQHIPQIIGAIRIFQQTGEKKYYDIASFFWDKVVSNHTYVIGGTGEGEMFHEPNKIGKQLSKNTAESCASYNMLKLTKELYAYSPKVSYMDYYERTMYNHIASSCDCKANGASTYFMPLAPGFSKEFDDENSCCHGTGLENHFKYNESIYFHDEESIYINLFISSSLNVENENILIKQVVEENRPGNIKIIINNLSDKSLKIRKPYWTTDIVTVKINGEPEVPVINQGYLTLSKKWNSGDEVEIDYPCSLHVEYALDDESLVSVLYGPYVLAAVTDKKEFIKLPLQESSIESILEQKHNKLEFLYSKENITFIPLSKVNLEKYQVYMKRG